MKERPCSLDMFPCDDSTLWSVQLSDSGGQDVFVHEEDRRRVQCSDLWCLQQGSTEQWIVRETCTERVFLFRRCT